MAVGKIGGKMGENNPRHEGYEVHLHVRSWCQVFNSLRGGVQVSAKRVGVALAHRGAYSPATGSLRVRNNTKVQTECRDTPSFSHRRIGDDEMASAAQKMLAENWSLVGRKVTGAYHDRWQI